MKTLAIIGCRDALGLVFGALLPAVGAQLEIVTNAEPQRIFSGKAENISVVWRNGGDQVWTGEISARIFQNSSATAMPLDAVPWKKLSVLPQQTVLESAQLNFPNVKAEAKFLVQWLENTNRVIGKTEVLVYPTNLLAELKPLAGGEPLGVFDPLNQLKPLLRNLKIDFVNLETSDLENYSGRLAILGPFPAKGQMREGLMAQIQALAKKGTGVVWMQPAGRAEKLSPSFYSVPGNSNATNAVVIVHPELVANLAGNPQSQVNLIYFCRLALQPETFQLPNLNTQP